MGSLIIFELARELGIDRVVCASSISVYGSNSDYQSDELPLHETARQSVASGVRLYGASKVYLEALAEAYGADGGPLIVGLRPSIVYGGAPTKNATVDWIHAAVASASKGQSTTIANGDAELSLVHVNDVVDQFTALLRAPRETFAELRFFNSGGDRCSVRDFAQTLTTICPTANIVVEPSTPGPVYGLATSIDDSEIRKVLGRPRRFSPLEVGIAKYVQSIQSASKSPDASQESASTHGHRYS